MKIDKQIEDNGTTSNTHKANKYFTSQFRSFTLAGFARYRQNQTHIVAHVVFSETIMLLHGVIENKTEKKDKHNFG